jgi:hypothetical protein
LFTGSPVSLFWPFEIYHSTGHRGWLDVLNIVIFEGYRDAAIIVGSAIIFSWSALPGPMAWVLNHGLLLKINN